MAEPGSQVQEIKSRLNILDVIQEYVPLKRAGSTWKARCPFHQEKTPSFVVSEERQSWHCFGACSEGGDIFSFVQKIEGMDFPEALRVLARKANVVLKRQDPKLITQRTRLLDLLTSSSFFYEQQLLDSPEGKIALDYFHDRGLTDATIERFHLGYAPKSWDATKNHLGAAGFSPQEIELAGLSIPRERGQGSYDRFRGRVMFPISDAQGTIVGFGGRRLKDEEEEGAKYINSPQTPLYDKSRVIYGFDRAKHAIRDAKRVVLVEGYMDVLSAHQAGVENVVAVSGTALTLEQVTLLKRATDTLVLMFDMDAAGVQAVGRGVRVALQSELTVLVASWDRAQAKDPDELLRNDPAAFTKAVKQAKPFVDFYFDRVLERADLQNVLHKKSVARILLSVIAQLSDPIEQTHYLQRLGLVLRVPEDVLRRALRRRPNAPVSSRASTRLMPSSPNSSQPPTPTPQTSSPLPQLLLGLVLLEPGYIPHFAATFSPEQFSTAEERMLAKAIILAYTKGASLSLDVVKQILLNESESTKGHWASILDRLYVFAQDQFGALTEDAREREFLRLIAHFQRDLLHADLRRLSFQLKQAEAANDRAGVERLSKEFDVLRTSLAQLTDS